MSIPNQISTVILMTTVFVTLSSCIFKDMSPEDYVYSPPTASDDGINTDTLESLGFDTEKTSDIARSILDDQFREINSVLIYRSGYLVYEEYFNNFNQNTIHEIRSATKSITGLLVGIAIDLGFLTGIEQKVFELFTQYETFDNWDPRKQGITVEHLLTMSSGLACDFDRVTSSDKQVLVYDVNDWVKLFLDAPVRNEPGQKFAYCTAGIVTLGEVIRLASGMSVEDFSEKYLFSPLGITNYKWEFTPAGQVDTGGHIWITARDMLKIGKLFLQDGMWNDQQILSKEWIDNSKAPYFENYGYTWWRSGVLTENANYLIYSADGNGGNRIFVVPEYDLVVVISGSNYNSEYGQASEYILHSFILPQLVR